MRIVHKVSFPLVPQLLNYLCEATAVYVRVMTSHGARVLTVASLQQLKMEALILTPADCEVRSLVKFLNA